MRIPPRYPLVALFGACFTMSQGTVYYVSPNGNDSNNGTSQATPWKTIDRVNQVTYQVVPGDQILFQRGGVYRGEIIWGTSGTSAAPMVMGAYGTGAAPIISGAKVVSGWTQYSGNIYRAYVGQQVDQVYVGGSRMTIARFPNTGWLRNAQGSNNTLYSTDLTQASGYWVGARAILRCTSSTYDTLRVTAYNSGTLTFSSNATNTNMATRNWGFFFENRLNLLDVAGEWFYEASSGYLYLQAPGNVNPSTLTVEASVYWSGVNCYWQRHYLTVQDLAFQYQRSAGIRQDGADHVTVNNCTFKDMYHGIRSVGSYDAYTNNTFDRTYATAIWNLDNNTTISGNTLTNIAMVPGAGESSWGYFGIRSMGTGNIIRNNRLDYIGYAGIEANTNTLIEKNVIKHHLACLNDGGGIQFDNTDGLTVQDNMIEDPICFLDGSSTHVEDNRRLGVGIYIGNISNKNVTIQRNTVMDIPGSGIHVDHTVGTTNIQVKDNILFNNDIQITISDYSTSVFSAQYNDIYSGNVFYCLTKDQLCMRQYLCHSTGWTDFGTFTNNRYYNPYNEMSIFIYNLSSFQKYFTLERWQTDRNEDAGSSRSPMRQNAYSTTSELSSNYITSGTFTTNVTGWGGWPTNAQVTRVTTNLDNGCLKAYLPDASVYPTFDLRNPEWFPVANGAGDWYRLRCSIQSNANGDLILGVKGASQAMNPYNLWQRQIPFGTERRDLEMYFQSPNAEQAQLQFINAATEPMYYLDNVEVKKVSVQAVDPLAWHTLLVNEQSSVQNLSLPAGCWSDLSGVVTSGSVSVPAYGSKVFYRVADSQCTPTGSTVSVKALLGGALNWSTGIMRDDLRTASLIPQYEPYSAMAWSLENSGVAVNSGLLATTGNTAIVDWVLVELRNNDQVYSVAARKACLIRRDGTIVQPDGNSVITFTTSPTVGKLVVVRHRNHTGAMTAAAITANGQSIDMSSPATALYGTEPAQTDGVRNALWLGNTTADIYVKYTGTLNDRDPILTRLGGSTPTSTVAGYYLEDVNMDGLVKYTGVSNDRDLVLTTVGGTIPTNTRTQQVP